MKKESKVKCILRVETSFFVLRKLSIISYNRRKGCASHKLGVETVAQSTW
jgi:hypothetical protein